jgi:hypothetical protein
MLWLVVVLKGQAAVRILVHVLVSVGLAASITAGSGLESDSHVRVLSDQASLQEMLVVANLA